MSYGPCLQWNTRQSSRSLCADSKRREELQTEKKQRAKQNRLFFFFLFWQKVLLFKDLKDILIHKNV